MPDEFGHLSIEEVMKCNARWEDFERKMGHDLACEICGGIKWSLLPFVMQMPLDSAAGLWGSTGRTPIISYMCSNCGNMKSFPAAKWNIDSVPAKEEQKEKVAAPETAEEVKHGD
jgi:hypothetical protein